MQVKVSEDIRTRSCGLNQKVWKFRIDLKEKKELSLLYDQIDTSRKITVIDINGLFKDRLNRSLEFLTLQNYITNYGY